MYKYLLQSVEGIENYGVFTLVLFFVFFSVIAIRAFMFKKEKMEKWANLPLEE